MTDEEILAAFKRECDAVGVPYDPAGLVRHHRGNAGVAAWADAHVKVAKLRQAVLNLHPKIDNPRHGCCAPPQLCQGHAPECGGRDHALMRPHWPCATVRAVTEVT